MPTNKKPKRPLTARTADPHHLYELAVQAPDAEVEFVSKVFKKVRGRPARNMREDFCGTGACACEWVKTHPLNRAVGLDLHKPTLAWGMRHNVRQLPEEAQGRVQLLARNVLDGEKLGRGVPRPDAVLAMNFSYWIFKTPELLGRYFETVQKSLAKDGVFFLDIYGGYEAQKIQTERRRCAGFTYVWDQAAFNPITYEITCDIHFAFKRGPMMKKAFTYDWRLWTIPEVRELLGEAGFRRSTVYWEGNNGRGGGDGVFRPRRVGEADASFIAYIVAEK